MGLEIKQLTRLQIIRYCEKLEKENKKLKEDNRFLIKISKEYMEKENIIEVTEFTRLYKDDLEEENKTLKDKIEFLTNCLDDRDKSIELMKEENKKIIDNYYNLSKIVETTGGYKSSYVNELRDKIAKLEFDIEARKKLKAVLEEKIKMLNEKIGKLVMNGK